MTTIGDDACFGLYADPETLPDADALALDLARGARRAAGVGLVS